MRRIMTILNGILIEDSTTILANWPDKYIPRGNIPHTVRINHMEKSGIIQNLWPTSCHSQMSEKDLRLTSQLDLMTNIHI